MQALPQELVGVVAGFLNGADRASLARSSRGNRDAVRFAIVQPYRGGNYYVSSDDGRMCRLAVYCVYETQVHGALAGSVKDVAVPWERLWYVGFLTMAHISLVELKHFGAHVVHEDGTPSGAQCHRPVGRNHRACRRIATGYLQAPCECYACQSEAYMLNMCRVLPEVHPWTEW